MRLVRVGTVERVNLGMVDAYVYASADVEVCGFGPIESLRIRSMRVAAGGMDVSGSLNSSERLRITDVLCQIAAGDQP